MGQVDDKRPVAPSNGTSRRTLLKATVASGLPIIGGCSATSGERNSTERVVTGGRGTDRRQNSQDGPIPEGGTVGLRRVAGGLTAPVQFNDPVRGSNRQFVADQTGEIHVLTPDGRREEPFLDVSDRLVDLGEGLPEWAVNEERGLLGLAFHPNYEENRRFYVRYSTPSGSDSSGESPHTEVLSEFRARPDSRFADSSSEQVILEISSPLPIHQAGTIAFGPDGYLYVAMGDGGIPDDAQDTTNLLGGVLRIDVNGEASKVSQNGGDGDQPYLIPKDNPLVDGPGRDELFAWGFRNPWRMSFDGDKLYAADVGSALYEEINVVRNGGNYGWPAKEGSQCIQVREGVGQPTECPDETTDGVGPDSLLDPVVQYPHSANDEIIGIAVIGGYVYHGEEIPSFSGTYVFGDYSSSYNAPKGRLFAATPSGEGDWRMAELAVANAADGRLHRSILSFGRGQDGELYVLTTDVPPSEAINFSRQSGEVYKIIPPA